jgi:hypothetical protein
VKPTKVTLQTSVPEANVGPAHFFGYRYPQSVPMRNIGSAHFGAPFNDLLKFGRPRLSTSSVSFRSALPRQLSDRAHRFPHLCLRPSDRRPPMQPPRETPGSVGPSTPPPPWTPESGPAVRERRVRHLASRRRRPGRLVSISAQPLTPMAYATRRLRRSGGSNRDAFMS